MNAQEVRLGNLLFDDQGKIVRVDNLTCHFDEIPLSSSIKANSPLINRRSPNSFSGIPIETKWLTKLSFEDHLKNDGYWLRKGENIKLYPKGENFFLVNDFGFEGIRYVHQLQNLVWLISRFDDDIIWPSEKQ